MLTLHSFLPTSFLLAAIFSENRPLLRPILNRLLPRPIPPTLLP